MDIKCGGCGGENLVRDPDAPKSPDIPLLCLDCGWRGRPTPRVSCPRCGSTDVDDTAVDGWAYEDLEEARDEPATAAWGYVEKTIYKCRKCRHEWEKPGEYRPYVARGVDDKAQQTGIQAFEVVWQRIKQYAGAEFITKTGKVFSYDFTPGAVVLRNTNRALPRGDFEKALARMPVAGPGDLHDLQGASYLYGILTDRRITTD
jgi:ribosomal protein L37AE/L43A